MAENGTSPNPGASSPPGTARVGLDHAEPGCFAGLLQSGFFLATGDTCTVRAFLLGIMGLDDNYILTRLQTVFLNGLAVDDLDAAMVRPGSRLALSAALPGLVGATMRRGGVFASLRQGVTHIPEHDAPSSGPFLAEVRLFNQIGDDLAARMLAQGVYVRAGKLLEFLKTRPPQFWDGVRSLTLGPDALDPSGGLHTVWPQPENLLLLTLVGTAAREQNTGAVTAGRNGA